MLLISENKGKMKKTMKILEEMFSICKGRGIQSERQAKAVSKNNN
jgi:hypothetical protein